jgi:hypothetical protein
MIQRFEIQRFQDSKFKNSFEIQRFHDSKFKDSGLQCVRRHCGRDPQSPDHIKGLRVKPAMTAQFLFRGCGIQSLNRKS